MDSPLNCRAFTEYTLTASVGTPVLITEHSPDKLQQDIYTLS